MKTFKEFLLEKTKDYNPDYSKYIKHTPDDIEGLRYYVLELPEGITPPVSGSVLRVNDIEVVSLEPMTPDDWRRGRGAPAAESMEKRGIAYSINCLPVGHPDLKNFNFK